MDDALPEVVLAAVTGEPGAPGIVWQAEPIATSSGAATGGVTRISGRTRDGRSFSLVRKEFRPLTEGRHASGAADPAHWAYWRREPLAYASGVLPGGPGLRAPRCYGVIGDVVYLEDVGTVAESPRIAARRLGAWQSRTPVPALPWLAGHQLAQRIAVTELDWSAVGADPRLADLWSRRTELLARLDSVPEVLSHGDFHIGQLVAEGPSTVVLDWATFGRGPVGADLAHLALSTRTDLVGEYLSASRFAADAVLLGYRATLGLTGASRIHWMLSHGRALPHGYTDFVVHQSAF